MSWRQVKSPAPARGGFLVGVAAISAQNAWAVGGNAGKTLILHWDGTTWKRVKSPAPAAGGFLNAIAATSPSNAWAVGMRGDGKPLIVHWNGSTWTEQTCPKPCPTTRGAGLVRRIRHFRARRLGGQRHRGQDPDPALDRHYLAASHQSSSLERVSLTA